MFFLFLYKNNFLGSCFSAPIYFRITVNGKLPLGVTSKAVILQIIGKIGTAGGTGCVIEYAGDLIRSLSVEQRMPIQADRHDTKQACIPN